jgi:uracil-DNA glycosylase
MVPFSGPEDAEILIVGEFPGDDEVEEGAPFVGKAGKILKTEMARAGIRWSKCRVGNLWQHKKNKDCDLKWHIAYFFNEFKVRKYVLMMGSEFSEYFYPGKVTDNSSLVYEHNGVIYVPTLNPASVPKSGVGEFQRAIQRLLALVEGEWEGEPYRYKSFGTKPERPSKGSGRGKRESGGAGTEGDTVG